MIDLTKSLAHLRPGELWTLNGDNYEGLEWLSETKKPTKKELEDVYPIVEAAAMEAETSRIAAQAAAIKHAKSLGFTDAMIAVMYPNLGA